MRDLQFHYHMDIVFSEPVYNHTYTLKCVPQTTRTQEITECIVTVFPEGDMQRDRDSFGNIMLYGKADEEQSLFSVDMRGRARTGIDRKDVAYSDMDLSVYKYQTSLTRPGSHISELFQYCQKQEQGSVRDRAVFYMHAVYERMRYTKCITNIDTTSEAALVLGRGVCQDYSHILLSLCREAKIPARYVVGMLVGEGESHAWVEFFDGERWIGLDPTNDLVVEEEHIKISHGRDYRDCSINRGVFTGQARQEQSVIVDVS